MATAGLGVLHGLEDLLLHLRLLHLLRQLLLNLFSVRALPALTAARATKKRPLEKEKTIYKRIVDCLLSSSIVEDKGRRIIYKMILL